MWSLKEMDIPPTLLATRFICSEDILVVIRMISINMMLKGKISKKLLRGECVQALDSAMAVQLLKKICTSLVDMKIKVHGITLFTLWTRFLMNGYPFQFLNQVVLYLNLDFSWVCLALNHDCTFLEDMTMMNVSPWMIFKNSVQKHTAGLNSLKSPKIMFLQEDLVNPQQVLVPVQD